MVLRAWDERDSRMVRHRGKRKIHFFSRRNASFLKEGEKENETTGKNIFIGLESDYIYVLLNCYVIRV